MLPKIRKLPSGLAIAAQSAEFWRRIAPDLTISDAQPKSPISRQSELSRKERMLLINDGFLHLKQPGIEADFAKLAVAMQNIVKAGLPPAFIGVYDEVWSIAGQLSDVMNVLLGGRAQLVPDFKACFGQPGDTGQPARRNRPGTSLFKDGTPKSAVVWLPLTPATTNNGCPYAVPAGQDANYGKPDGARADSSLLAIRALPANPGDIVVLGGETYHWHSRPARHNEDGPLISLCWEFQSREAAPVEGMVIDSYPYVPFETRLGLLARQMPKQNSREISANPIWRAVQQTLANRYPLGRGGLRA